MFGEAVEVVCGFLTVAVLMPGDDATPAPEAVAAGVARVVAAAAGASGPGTSEVRGGGRLVTVPCAFDGPDLGEVAAAAGCGPDEVVAGLTAEPLTVAVLGFSPGFAYLEGLPSPLRALPRRDRPRPAVPAGSVALAAGRAAVYPTASPGGWQLVGRTGVPLFGLDAPPYAVLAPGDRVHFTVAAAGDALEPPPLRLPPWTPPAHARLVLEVVSPGLRAVLQDGGRRGVAAAGVPAAGPADPVSFALANRLVGNPAGAGTVEITGGGARLRALGACHVAGVGAAPMLRVDGTEVPDGHVVPLDPARLLEVGPIRRGCRTYVAVAGGFVGPTAFGSSASDELSGLGAGPLAAGARLHAGPWAPPLGDHLASDAASAVGDGEEPVALRVVPGPHAELFAPDVLAHMGGVVFRVERDSNRVGVRLRAEDGAVPRWLSTAAGDLDSQGVVTGAVQVPPGGNPVVLLPDHATLGGYPVVGVVATADHGLLGQCAPGTRVRLVPTDLGEARRAAAEAARARARAVVGHYPLAAG